MRSLLPKDITKYSRCKKCGLWKHRKQVILGHGDVPADALFVGIGPGKNEDLLGEAFIGRSGRLLKAAITRARKRAGLKRRLKRFFVNLVGCRPCDGPREPNRDPTDTEILACRPRLMTTIAFVRAEIIVLLGNLAQEEMKAFCPGALKLRHPAYLLRRGGERSAEFRSFVQHLSSAFEGLD